MPRFIAESYLPLAGAAGLDASVARARQAAAALSRAGTPVRHVRSTLVPEDEVCLHVFEAQSAGAVGEAGERAALRVARIVEVVEAAIDVGEEPE